MVARELRDPELLESPLPSWEQAMGQFPDLKTPSFLTPAEFLVSREWCGFGTQYYRTNWPTG